MAAEENISRLGYTRVRDRTNPGRHARVHKYTRIHTKICNSTCLDIYDLDTTCDHNGIESP